MKDYTSFPVQESLILYGIDLPLGRDMALGVWHYQCIRRGAVAYVHSKLLAKPPAVRMFNRSVEMGFTDPRKKILDRFSLVRGAVRGVASTEQKIPIPHTDR